MSHRLNRFVEEVVWFKTTKNNKLAKGNGYYLQHSKESCLVGKKGNVKVAAKFSNIIFAQRRGQSQKPAELYTMIEKMFPQGYYLEIFGRRNNIREGWVTMGNEI